MKAIAIVSGGMDSITLAYRLRADGYDLHMLTFNYGQRHVKEIDSAHYFANLLGAKIDTIDISNIKPLLKGSALTDEEIAVPHGHYAEESMKQTVVPNRNAIMISMAWGVAVAESADLVALAVHSGDHHIYPDCRPAFIDSMNAALRISMEGHRTEGLHIYAPYLTVDKAAIASDGKKLAVPYEKTWTCYEGGDIHCGQCGACVERQEAFHLAGVTDKTAYHSPLSFT